MRPPPASQEKGLSSHVCVLGGTSVERHPGLRGIGIDEATAIVVHGREFEVIGVGTVTVVDHHVTVLTSGQHFDLQRDTLVAR